MKQCPRCQQYVDDYSAFCNNCGYNFTEQHQAYQQTTPPPINQPEYSGDNAFDPCGPEGKSRGVCALLAILVGGFGVHYFYLGKAGGGILTLVLSMVTCGLWTVITLIQGILMFCMTNQQFRQKYVLSQSTMPLF